jgi:hypothetical protein
VSPDALRICQFALDKTLDSSLGTPNLRDLQPSRSHQLVPVINENVIPDTNAYWETTSLDIIMMADFASTERTEDANSHSIRLSTPLWALQIFVIFNPADPTSWCQ